MTARKTIKPVSAYWLNGKLMPWRYQIDKKTDCWNWLGSRSKSGYGLLYFQGRNNARAHRVFYEQYIGPIPDGLFACHKCDNPLCVNPSHIFIGDAKANALDMFSKGRQTRLRAMGERNPSTKISDSKYPAFINEVRSSLSSSQVARNHGVSRTYVYLLRNGKAAVRDVSHLGDMNENQKD